MNDVQHDRVVNRRRFLGGATAAVVTASLSSGRAAAAAGPTSSELARWRGHASRVTITRDDWGIAHVHGRTDASAVFGMMYAQAEDDFNRIETNYLTSLGRLAEANGERALWQDLRQRLFIDPEVLRCELYPRSPGWLRELMEAWADGLNYYLAVHPEVRPLVLTRFEPWMALSFTEGSIGGDITRASLSRLQAFYDHQASPVDAEPEPPHEPTGSNGIAIAPNRTRNGNTLLLINPHTTFYFRSEQHVTSGEGLNAYGAATWGQFFLYQGFNANVGWMHTSTGADNIDEFAETIVPGEHGRLSYRYGAALRPVAKKTITLAYRTAEGTAAERSFTTFATHHGPIVGETGGKWIAFALMNKPVEALQQSYLRTKARNYAEYLKVAEFKANSSNNTIFADSSGEIAFLMPQFMPIRDDRFDYTKPVDGSDPATDWRGLHRLEDLPRAVNPRHGWVFNSNNWPWTCAGPDSPEAADYPKYLDQVGETPRGPHAVRLLSERKVFTAQTLRDVAFDSRIPAFAPDTGDGAPVSGLIPRLVEAWEKLPAGAPRKAKLADPIALLRGWDYRWGVDSTETSLAVFWAAGPRDTDEQRLASLEAAMERLTHDFGGWRVPWGEINRFQRLDDAIDQTFDDAKPSTSVPFVSAKLGSLASFAADRGPERPGGTTKRFYGTSGNTFVAVVEFGPRPRAMAVREGGASGHPGSPHFADQADRYASGNLRPVYFHPDDLTGHIERRYHPGG
ncbi:penicillin acylase family protein [Amycolatopsis sp. CA-230715]|uniref:penicillin acylase family protein n=1 Tax=Amycolatopsis sp. CA-230715 TaxID=2745196 RepID=UPI001C034FA1|nr:penicillin acylase family protein [Amycolatopsis sp. CA-230715]QWF77878.1 Glutaryl-7-aminocephalosporanic-acid acylase [Amycolatopsis sp. CA-230715]